MNGLDRRTRMSISLALILLASAIAILPAASGEDEGDYPYVYGYVYVAGTGGVGSSEAVPEATVHLFNVHTGEQYNTTTTVQGKFQFPPDSNNDNKPDFELLGQFYLTAEADGYFAGPGAKSDVFGLGYFDLSDKAGVQNFEKKELFLVEVMPDIPTTVMGYIQDEDSNNGVADAHVNFYSLEADHSGFMVSTESMEKNASGDGKEAGYFEIETFTGNVNIQIIKAGYQVTSFNVMIDGSNPSMPIASIHGTAVDPADNYTEVDLGHARVNLSKDGMMTVTIDQGGDKLSIRGIFESEAGQDITDISVRLWDRNNSREIPVPLNADKDSSFSVDVYPSTYHLIMDAEGYLPKYYNNILIDQEHKTFTGGGSQDPFMENLFSSDVDTMTTITGDNMTDLKMEVTWTANSDTDFLGIGSYNIGDPRYKIDTFLGNGDGTVDANEVANFTAWLSAYGPMCLYTDGYIMLNGHRYDPLDVDAFAPVPSGFGGAVEDNNKRMTVTYTLDYQLNGTMEEENMDAFTLMADVMDMEEMTVTVPSKYELMSNDDAFTLDDTKGNMGTIERGSGAVTITIQETETPMPEINITQVSLEDGNNTGEVYKAEDGTYYVKPGVEVTFNSSKTMDNNMIGERAVLEKYEWIVVREGDTSFNTPTKTTEEFTFNFTAAGTYKVKLTVWDSSHISNSTTIKIVVDGTAPTVDFWITDDDSEAKEAYNEVLERWEFDQETRLNFTSKVSDAGGLRKANSVEKGYEWDLGSGPKYEMDVETTPSEFAEYGEYTVMLTARDAAGNEANRTYTIYLKDTKAPTIPEPPRLEPDPVQANMEVLLNLSSVDDNAGQDNLTFEWWFIDDASNDTEEFIEDAMKESPDKSGDYDKASVVNNTYTEPGDHMVITRVTDKVGNEEVTHRTVSVQGPNLIVKLVERKPADVEEEEKVTFVYNVTNTGQVAVDTQFKVVLKVDGKQVGEEMLVDYLGTGASKTLNFTWTPDKKGTFNVTCEADTEAAIVETNEGDNIHSHNVKVDEKPLPTGIIALVVIIVIIVVGAVVWKLQRKKMYDSYRDKVKGGKDKGGKDKKSKKGKKKDEEED